MNVKVLLLLLFFAGCVVALGFIFGSSRGGEAELTNSDGSDNGDAQELGNELVAVAESAENEVTPAEAAGGDDAREEEVGDVAVAESAENVNPPVVEEVSDDTREAGEDGLDVVDSVDNEVTPAEAAGGDDQRVGDASEGVAGSAGDVATPVVVEGVDGDTKEVGEAGKGVVGPVDSATNVEQDSGADPVDGSGSDTVPDAGTGNLRGDGATTPSVSSEPVTDSPKSPDGETTGDADPAGKGAKRDLSGRSELGLLSGMVKTAVNYVKPGITDPDANDELNILGKGIGAVFNTFLGTDDAKKPEVPKAAESTVQQGSHSTEQDASSQQQSQESQPKGQVTSSQEQPQGSQPTNEGASSQEESQGSQSTEQGAPSQEESQA